MRRFEFTGDGYSEAKKWLKDTNQYHLLDYEASRDGWTLVALANYLWSKQCGTGLK